PHQMRRDAIAQQAPLGQRFMDKTELGFLQIPDTAVDQLARPARRARRKIACLYQRDLEAPARSVQGSARPSDATPDDEHIEMLVAHGRQALRSSLRAQRPGLESRNTLISSHGAYVSGSPG